MQSACLGRVVVVVLGVVVLLWWGFGVRPVLCRSGDGHGSGAASLKRLGA